MGGGYPTRGCDSLLECVPRRSAPSSPCSSSPPGWPCSSWGSPSGGRFTCCSLVAWACFRGGSCGALKEEQQELQGLQGRDSAATGLASTPRPGISTATRSPSGRGPEPAGVPVRGSSPGSRVIIREL